MDPTTTASATALLTALGLGKSAAGILSLIALVVMVVAHIMPYMPVPTATSAAWYSTLFSIMSKMTGNYLKNTPVAPVNIVPVPLPQTPPLKPSATASALFLLIFTSIALSACAVQQNTASLVAKVQADWGVITAAIAVYDVQPGAQTVTKNNLALLEKEVSPIVAALSSASTPTNLRDAIVDIQAVIATLPPSVVDPATAADIAFVLSIVNAEVVGVSVIPAPTATVPAAP